MAFARTTDGTLSYWSDPDAAAAHLRRAVASLSEERERALSGAPSPDQDAALSEGLDHLAAAYLYANVRPTADPIYLAVFGDAYKVDGVAFDPLSMRVAMPTPAAANGWLVRQAVGVAVAVSGIGAVPTVVRVRAALGRNAELLGSCRGASDPGCEVFQPSNPRSTRAHPGGGACADPVRDWECVSWFSDASGVEVLPAAVWSFGLLRLVATAAARDVPAWIRAAYANGNAAISGSATTPPSHRVPDGPTTSVPIEPTSAPAAPSAPAPGRDSSSVTTREPVTAADAGTLLPILLGAAALWFIIVSQRPAKRR